MRWKRMSLHHQYVNRGHERSHERGYEAERNVYACRTD